MALLKIASAIAAQLASSFLLNFIFLVVYAMLVYVIRAQYERYKMLEDNRFVKPVGTVKDFVKESVLFGAVAGFITSFFSVVAGITVDSRSYEYMVLILIILRLINIRYLCIAYAGGILALINTVFGLKGSDASSILALIAILHIVESAMIYASPGKYSIPVLIKHKEGIVGAFFTQRFWPVPVVLLTFLPGAAGQSLLDIIAGGSWMPFRPEAAGAASSLGLGCIAAVLGYSDVCITKEPDKKSRETAGRLLLYSSMLLIIAWASVHIHVFKIIGAVFAIAGHEGIIIYGKHKEKNGRPLFETVRRGVKVFDIPVGSHAHRMGMKRGDVILSVNGRDVQTEEGIAGALMEFPTFIWVDAVDADGNKKYYEYRCFPNGADNLGIMTVPREERITYNIDYFEDMSVLKNMVQRFKGTGRTF